MQYWGEHDEQGGISFQNGVLGMEDVEALLKFVGKQQKKYQDDIVQMIKDNQDE
jgi:hypothetical protein